MECWPFILGMESCMNQWCFSIEILYNNACWNCNNQLWFPNNTTLTYIVLWFGMNLTLYATISNPTKLNSSNLQSVISIRLKDLRIVSYVVFHQRSKGVFYQRLSFIKDRLPSKDAFHQRLPFIKGCLPSKVKGVFLQRSSSIKSCLLSKVLFHQSSFSIKGYLPSKSIFPMDVFISSMVIFHRSSSSIKGPLPSKDMSFFYILVEMCAPLRCQSFKTNIYLLLH